MTPRGRPDRGWAGRFPSTGPSRGTNPAPSRPDRGSAGRRRDRGSAALETAVLMPLFVALICVALALGRTAGALAAVEMAAYAGARTASLARQAADAEAAATAAVTHSLAEHGYACRDGPQVTVDTAGFAEPVGTPASVTVRVACRVSYADLGPLELGDRIVSAEFVSPLDLYRGRG